MIQSTTRTISHSCNGTVNTFAIPFKFYSAEHLTIYLFLSSLPVPDFDQEYNYDNYGTIWTVTGVGDDAGGELTLVDIPPEGAIVRIDRTVPEVQLTDYINNGRFDAEAHEKQMDLIVMMIQQKMTIPGPTLG